jgi:hypothetical protein
MSDNKAVKHSPDKSGRRFLQGALILTLAEWS